MTRSSSPAVPTVAPTMALLGDGRHDEIVPVADARISPFDRGFLFGDGVYESTRVFAGHPVALDAHVARLERSLCELDITGFDATSYRTIIDRLLEAEGVRDASVYLQVTRGSEIPRRHVPGGSLAPTVFAFATPMGPLESITTIETVDATLAPDDRWMRTDIKSVNLLANVMAAMRGHANGAAETILHRDGLVSEGTHSTILAVIDGELVAPAITAAPSILPGTMRPLVLEAAQAAGIPIRERAMAVAELRAATEIGIASSNRLLHAVGRLDGRPIAGGPWMQRLLDTMVGSIRAAIAAR
jgi:D-alanine transaminase